MKRDIIKWLVTGILSLAFGVVSVAAASGSGAAQQLPAYQGGNQSPAQTVNPFDPNVDVSQPSPPSQDDGGDGGLGCSIFNCGGPPKQCLHSCLALLPGQTAAEAIAAYEKANHCKVAPCTPSPLPGGQSSQEYELHQLERPDMENMVSYLYLDSAGKVTVGIGTMLPDAAAAEALPFQKCDKDNKCVPATKAEIDEAYKAVAKEDVGYAWTHYKQYTSLSLLPSDMEKLATEHLDKDHTSLLAQFPDFDTYPPHVQAALYDMMYNLGPGGLKNKFPEFVKAIKKKDWKKAATESNRPQLNDYRNNYVSGFLMDAYNDDKKCKESS